MARNRYILNNGEFGNLSTTFTRNVATVDGFAQAITITSLNGIKFVADGAPFRGVSELTLPYYA